MVKPYGLAAEWLYASRSFSPARLSLILISKNIDEAEFSNLSKLFLNDGLCHTRLDSGQVQAGMLGRHHAREPIIW